MVRRTTVLLDEDIYKMLVRESIKRYGTAKAISRILNELLRERLRDRKELVKLIYSSKLVKITQEEFERSRRELSKRFENR